MKGHSTEFMPHFGTKDISSFWIESYMISMVTFVIGPSIPLLSSCNGSSTSTVAGTGFFGTTSRMVLTVPEFQGYI